MTSCKAPDHRDAATTLYDALRDELRAQRFDAKQVDGTALLMMGDLLECTKGVVSDLLEGREVCARVLCTLKDRTAGGGGLQGARDQRAREWQRIQERQDAAIEGVKEEVAAGKVETWQPGMSG
jgi:hypothetical protein